MRYPPSTWLSIIIPVLDEGRSLARTLDSLAPSVAAMPVEVILVDGGSRDRTLEIARAYPWVKTLEYGRACRGAQMNEGARASVGEALVFLHGDVILPADALFAVSEALAEAEVSGGCFEVCFPPNAPRSMRIQAAGINLRTRLGRTATGDQAIFVRRAVFEAIGGYREQPLMEDIALFTALKKRGRVVVLPGPVEISPRRWLERGVWRTMWLMYALRLGYWLGCSPVSLKKFFSDVR